MSWYVLVPLYVTFSIAGAHYLSHKWPLSVGILALIPVSWIAQNHTNQKQFFLRSIFNQRTAIRITLLENLMMAFPFFILLAYYHAFIFAIVLLLFAGLMPWLPTTRSDRRPTPTPFFRRPHEYIIGWRKTFLSIILVYLVFIPAVLHDNVFIGVLGMVLLTLLGISFFAKPDKDYMVWIFQKSPSAFLLMKAWHGLMHQMMITIPLYFLLVVVFPNDMILLSALFVLGWMYILCAIFAKYAAHPRELDLPEGVLMAFTLAFPPLLPFVAMYFYHKAKNQLQSLL